MKRILQTVLLCLCIVMTAQAKGWDEQQYRQIEQSIRLPQTSTRTFLITDFGADADASPRKNQKAIRKAMEEEA